MRKYRFTITALVPLSDGKNQEIYRVEFFANGIEEAEKFKVEVEELYFKTNAAFRPDPPFPRQDNLIDITDEPDLSNVVRVGAQEW